MNPACSKVLGPAKIFQFEDIGNENRFMWALFAVTANGLISKNETLVSLISNMNWSARWELLTKLIKRSNSTREHDAVPRQSSVRYVPTKVIRDGISVFGEHVLYP